MRLRLRSRVRRCVRVRISRAHCQPVAGSIYTSDCILRRWAGVGTSSFESGVSRLCCRSVCRQAGTRKTEARVSRCHSSPVPGGYKTRWRSRFGRKRRVARALWEGDAALSTIMLSSSAHCPSSECESVPPSMRRDIEGGHLDTRNDKRMTIRSCHGMSIIHRSTFHAPLMANGLHRFD